MKEVICDCSGHVKGENGGGKIITRTMTKEEHDALVASFVQPERPKSQLEILQEKVAMLEAKLK